MKKIFYYFKEYKPLIILVALPFGFVLSAILMLANGENPLFSIDFLLSLFLYLSAVSISYFFIRKKEDEMRKDMKESYKDFEEEVVRSVHRLNGEIYSLVRDSNGEFIIETNKLHHIEIDKTGLKYYITERFCLCSFLDLDEWKNGVFSSFSLSRVEEEYRKIN